MNQPNNQQLAPVDFVATNLITKANVNLIAGKLGANEAIAREYLGNIITAVRNAPDRVRPVLEKCSPESFLAAARQAIDLDLKIDHNAHGYLVPYAGRAVFQVGWRGYLYRLKKHNPTLEIQVGIVMPGDKFTISSEDGLAKYVHEKVNPFNSDFKNAIGAYCYMSYEIDGKPYSIVEPVGIQEIMQMKNAAKTKEIWDTWFGEMMKKSVIRRAAKVAFSGVVGKLDEYDNQNFQEPEQAVNDDATSKTESVKNQLRAKANPKPEPEIKTVEGGEVIENPKSEPTPPQDKKLKCLNCDGKGAVQWSDPNTGEVGSEPCASCEGAGTK